MKRSASRRRASVCMRSGGSAGGLVQPMLPHAGGRRHPAGAAQRGDAQRRPRPRVTTMSPRCRVWRSTASPLECSSSSAKNVTARSSRSSGATAAKVKLALVAEDEAQPAQLLDQRHGEVGEVARVGHGRLAQQRRQRRRQRLRRQGPCGGRPAEQGRRYGRVAVQASRCAASQRCAQGAGDVLELAVAHEALEEAARPPRRGRGPRAPPPRPPRAAAATSSRAAPPRAPRTARSRRGRTRRCRRA